MRFRRAGNDPTVFANPMLEFVVRGKARTVVRRTAAEVGVREPRLGFTDEFNAAARGFGRWGFMALGLPLVRDLSDSELEAAVAHEMSHIRRWKRTLVAEVGVPCVVVGAGLASVAEVHGTSSVLFPAAAALLVVASFLSKVCTRCNEYLADRDSAEVTGNPEAMATALQRTSENAKERTATDWVRERCGLADHPSTERRVARLRALVAQREL